MHAYNRMLSAGQSTPSPPRSPFRSPHPRSGRSKSGRHQGLAQPNLLQRLTWPILSVFLRRQGLFLFAPLLYISGMLLYMGSVSLDVPVLPVIIARRVPGSVYRSSQLYDRIRLDMNADNFSDGVSSSSLSSSFSIFIGLVFLTIVVGGVEIV